ncbi:MAG: response regulator [Cyanobacteria bacterium CRU_2_1]|nr:response regulator [Cyanobacteria bacterium CRU_2_1]
MPFLISFVHTIAAQETGYQVDSAHIGVDALIQLEQSPPDSLLLDTTTADMDGYEVTRRIRQNAELPFPQSCW